MPKRFYLLNAEAMLDWCMKALDIQVLKKQVYQYSGAQKPDETYGLWSYEQLSIQLTKIFVGRHAYLTWQDYKSVWSSGANSLA